MKSIDRQLIVNAQPTMTVIPRRRQKQVKMKVMLKMKKKMKKKKITSKGLPVNIPVFDKSIQRSQSFDKNCYKHFRFFFLIHLESELNTLKTFDNKLLNISVVSSDTLLKMRLLDLRSGGCQTNRNKYSTQCQMQYQSISYAGKCIVNYRSVIN